jgi:hypothetical protein
MFAANRRCSAWCGHLTASPVNLDVNCVMHASWRCRTSDSAKTVTSSL